jgi:hypothetical protein
LGAEVVNLVGHDLAEDSAEPGAVSEVAVVKLESDGMGAEAFVQMVDSPGGNFPVRSND